MLGGTKMALNPRTQPYARSVDRAGEIDAGLRSYMLRVYNYMALGVALTGIVAMGVAMNPALMQAVAVGPFKWVLFFGILGLGFFSQRLIAGGSMAMAPGDRKSTRMNSSHYCAFRMPYSA